MKQSLIVLGWLFSCVILLIVSGSTIHFLHKPQQAEPNNRLAHGNRVGSVLAYNTQSGNLPSIELTAGINDARVIIIERYFARYGSPAKGYGQLIVSTADKLAEQYGIDATHLAYITIAIGQQESNLGKKMPPNCHNMWGWGIHSAGTLCFDNWEEGIVTFMSGLAESYMHKRGLITPDEIMTVYIPHSPGGAWARNVNFFLKRINSADF